MARLDSKNEFVIALRNHLMFKYSTDHHYTLGEGNFESKKIGDGYCRVRRDSKKPREISGFCFRKDLCFCAPQDSSRIIEDVHNFAQRDKNLESVLDKEGNKLTIEFGDERYLVTSYIEEGYAGEISISFMELPHFYLNVS